MTKTGPAAVSSAAAVEYVIGVRNDGPSMATDVVVTDTLPEGMTPRPVAGCTITGSTVSCALASVAPGATGSITVTADVDPNLAVGTELTDVATIGSDAAGFDDPDPANNTAELTSTVRARNDVGVTVTANQDEVTGGSAGQLHRRRHQQRAAAGQRRRADEPATARARRGDRDRWRWTRSAGRLPLQVPPECVADGTTATCALGDLPVGESRTFEFGGTVADGTPVGTELVHTATVSFNGTDAVEANNTDADTILVVAQPAPTTPRTRP